MCSNHLACRIYALGSAVLFGTSFPAEMRSNVAPIGFILGSILIAVGLGGVQASAQPFIGRGCPSLVFAQFKEDPTHFLLSRPIYRANLADKGCKERQASSRNSRSDYPVNLQCVLLVCRVDSTFQNRRLSLLTGMDHHSRMVNVSSLGSIATTLMERYIGFWSAYLLDLCAVMIAVVVVHLAKPKFGMIQASSSQLLSTIADPERINSSSCRTSVRPSPCRSLPMVCCSGWFQPRCCTSRVSVGEPPPSGTMG